MPVIIIRKTEYHVVFVVQNYGLVRYFNLHLGSSRIVVELGEADQDSLFKVDKIPKSVTHTFHCLDRIVNALNDTCGHPIYKVV